MYLGPTDKINIFTLEGFRIEKKNSKPLISLHYISTYYFSIHYNCGLLKLSKFINGKYQMQVIIASKNFQKCVVIFFFFSLLLVFIWWCTLYNYMFCFNQRVVWKVLTMCLESSKCNFCKITEIAFIVISINHSKKSKNKSLQFCQNCYLKF